MVQASEILEIIREAVVAGEIDKIGLTTQFKDAGIDSLDMMNVFLSVEERYGVKIPDEKVGELQDIQAILAYLNSQGL